MRNKEKSIQRSHDLRTPLTVVKGYSDFLARYIPEGKVSEEKLVDTLRLMSEHIQRLEKYSRTMREIRNFDEWDINKEETDILRLQGKIEEMAEALAQSEICGLHYNQEEDKSKLIWLDEMSKWKCWKICCRTLSVMQKKIFGLYWKRIWIKKCCISMSEMMVLDFPKKS